ncbi:tyrosine phosphatase family protein [Rhodococcus sp. SMB37]|uniref:tyrosine-protein phosphatase n=1 Tax=Rhodococcus sp. SMB37 TaxID=2512213 RepID=UPI0010DB6E01|nr:tyrosine-protein phosphatase [Rhodococcus sp. SMB37]TCN53657.1 tyrosine phosphatase family protein [Rhodococcus sp. SMB37]
MIESGTAAHTIPGLANLRDVAGLPMQDGGATRPGVLYRSDAPRTDDPVPEHVSSWPPSVVIDLRSNREVQRSRCDWPDRTTVHHHPLHDAAAPGVTPPGNLPALYDLILDSGATRIAALVSLVAQADGPVLVHCAVGKDRTGVAIAALLLAADVRPEAVIADYLATASNMPALRQRWASIRTAQPARPLLDDHWLETPEPAITAVVERITTAPGGPKGWLRNHGADDADLRRWHRRIRL